MLCPDMWLGNKIFVTITTIEYSFFTIDISAVLFERWPCQKGIWLTAMLEVSRIREFNSKKRKNYSGKISSPPKHNYRFFLFILFYYWQGLLGVKSLCPIQSEMTNSARYQLSGLMMDNIIPSIVTPTVTQDCLQYCWLVLGSPGKT